MQPVQPIELSEKNKRLRMILAIAALVLALVMFSVFFINLLSKEPGWQEIKTDSAANNCSSEFVLQYYLGDKGASATEEHKKLKVLYTEATEKAYRIFHPELTEDELKNLAHINANPNKAVTVDPVLYRSLEKIVSAGDRTVYLANVTAQYSGVFSAESEFEAVQYDPSQDPKLKAYVQELAGYANDADHISISLLGNDQVQLNVSDEYAALCAEYELECYLDLGWMKNAFIADFLAQTLTDAGYTNGYLTSVDGYTRNLDPSDRAYTANIFDRDGLDVCKPGQMTYQGACSVVALRNFPQLEDDRWRCFAFSDGHMVSTYIDPADGMSKSSTDTILSYSKTASCADIVLKLSDIFVADTLDSGALLALSEQGIASIWCEETKLCYTDSQVNLELTDSQYTAHHVTQ